MGRNKEGSSNLVGATHKAALKHDICAWVSGKKSSCFDWTHLTEIDQKVVRPVKAVLLRRFVFNQEPKTWDKTC